MQRHSAFSAIRRRHLIACVLALLTAVVMIPGMTTYLPFDVSDRILLPIMLFPLLWLGLFLYAYLAERVWHPTVLMLVLVMSHAGLCYQALSGTSA